MTASLPDTKPPSWEDYLEVFYAPTRVFQRRGTKWGGPFLVLFLASAVVILGTYTLLRPLYEADGQRAMASRMAEMTAEQREQMAQMSGKWAFMAPLAFLLFTVIIPLVLGVLLWLVGKLLGAAQELGAAMMVAVFSYFPRILYGPILALQAAILPEEKLTGFASVSLSPARMVAATNDNVATLALLARFDVFVLWTTFLLALGLKVTGKLSTQKAILAGVIMWLLGTLQPLFAYLRG
jgi:hypothetical protein